MKVLFGRHVGLTRLGVGPLQAVYAYGSLDAAKSHSGILAIHFHYLTYGGLTFYPDGCSRYDGCQTFGF